MIKKGIDHINKAYLGEVRQAKETGDEIPTYANYFKNQTSILTLMRTELPVDLKEVARKVIES